MSITAGYAGTPSGDMRRELRMLHAARHRVQCARRASGTGLTRNGAMSTGGRPANHSPVRAAGSTRRN